MKQPSILGVALVACVTLTVSASSEANTQRPASPPKLVVLDVELSGDVGGPELVPEHQARLKLASARLRESLSRTGLYQLVDSTAARSTLEELRSRLTRTKSLRGSRGGSDREREINARAYQHCATPTQQPSPADTSDGPRGFMLKQLVKS